MGCLQSLHVGSQARDTHQGHVIHFEYTLEVSINSHKVSGEASIGGDGNTVLASHSYHRVSVVRVELKIKGLE